MRRRLRFPSAVFESGGRYDFGDGQGEARWGGRAGNDVESGKVGRGRLRSKAGWDRDEEG